jgi:hypothetical protein
VKKSGTKKFAQDEEWVAEKNRAKTAKGKTNTHLKEPIRKLIHIAEARNHGDSFKKSAM